MHNRPLKRLTYEEVIQEVEPIITAYEARQGTSQAVKYDKNQVHYEAIYHLVKDLKVNNKYSLETKELILTGKLREISKSMEAVKQGFGLWGWMQAKDSLQATLDEILAKGKFDQIEDDKERSALREYRPVGVYLV